MHFYLPEKQVGKKNKNGTPVSMEVKASEFYAKSFNDRFITY
jgi:hypothetical protein